MDKEKKDFIRKGAFGWGIPVAVIWSIFMSLGPLYEKFNLKSLIVHLIIAIPLFMIGGCLFGFILYKRQKK